MKLIIAEKPSLGRAIAAVLPRPHNKKEGYIETASGDCVTWCIGHLLETAKPENYDSDFKQWRMEHLPIIPQQWLSLPRKDSKAQLTIIKKLLNRADHIVHAGDPDREGQLLVDEVLFYLKLSATRRQRVQRLLINDMNPQAIKKALANLRSNNDFIPLSTSALARSRADWLYGINMTRAFTVLGKKAGFNGLLSVGRVQTPLLGLVVRRDIEIEQFQSKPFYEVYAFLLTPDKITFQAKWLPSESCQPWMDEKGHVLDKRLAENVIQRIAGAEAKVILAEKNKKKEPPPLPYSLSALQIDAAKELNISAAEVLTHCQKLYEQKLITYPRSDCRYLPKAHFSQAAEVLASVRHNHQALISAVDNAVPNRPGRAWNDKKVSAHHAIIPTHFRKTMNNYTSPEAKIYRLIARHYVAQFYPDHQCDHRRIDINIEGGLFRAQSQTTTQEGWQVLMDHKKKNQETDKRPPPLPALKKEDPLQCTKGELKEKETTPPKPFTDASLLSAMTGIARYVNNPETRKVLRDTDGLGTEATRAHIIELLFKREFLMRQGRNIHSTPSGRALIQVLPEKVTHPDMTAKWESFLESIVDRTNNYANFMADLVSELNSLLDGVSLSHMTAISHLPSTPTQYRKKSSRSGRLGKKRKKVSRK